MLRLINRNIANDVVCCRFARLLRSLQLLLAWRTGHATAGHHFFFTHLIRACLLASRRCDLIPNLVDKRSDTHSFSRSLLRLLSVVLGVWPRSNRRPVEHFSPGRVFLGRKLALFRLKGLQIAHDLVYLLLNLEEIVRYLFVLLDHSLGAFGGHVWEAFSSPIFVLLLHFPHLLVRSGLCLSDHLQVQTGVILQRDSLSRNLL